MSANPLVSVRIKNVLNTPHLAWAENQPICLPQSVLSSSGLTPHLDTHGNLTIPPERVQISPEEPGLLRLRTAFTNRKPLSSRLPFSYQRVPHRLRNILASALGRWKRRAIDRWAVFPGWPLDLSADFLTDLVNGTPAPFAEGPTPVLLSHDLDSPEGLENLVDRFLKAEEAVGAQSTNYIVPCGWSINYDLLDRVYAQGHKIGVHGYDHSNRTPFCSARERRSRLEASQEIRDRYSILGYRAPSLLRTPHLLQDLADFYLYDSSIPTSGGLFPVPNNGCASARPFWIDRIAELPLSLPRDGSLRFLGYSPEQSADIWIRCAGEISRSGGVVVLLTHCEDRFSGNRPMLDAYRRFLDFVASTERFVWSTPTQVLNRALGMELP